MMPISGSGWELHVVRQTVQRRPSDGKKRTVGTYRIYHDGVEQAAVALRGTVAESKPPGANHPVNNGKRIEEGRYPVSTHQGPRYRTIGYDPNSSSGGHRKPALLFLNTGARVGILIHPGVNFLSSIGCFNPCTSLPNAAEPMDWDNSLRRMIAIIDDLRSFSGASFPNANGIKLPRAQFVVDGEPN